MTRDKESGVPAESGALPDQKWIESAAQEIRDEFYMSGEWPDPVGKMVKIISKHAREVLKHTPLAQPKEYFMMPSQQTTTEIIARLRETRTQLHETFGVPISEEYAAFLDAIGQAEDRLSELAELKEHAPLPELQLFKSLADKVEDGEVSIEELCRPEATHAPRPLTEKKDV